MSEFFGRLESQVREAAVRPPRRPVPVPAIAVALLAVAVAPIVFVLGSGSDSRDPAQPSREDPVQPPERGELPHFPGERVVATGVAPVAGPWELLTYESERLADPETGDVYQPAGLRCLGIRLTAPPPDHASGLAGQCGEFPRTPGFGRVQMTVPNVRGGAREILVYGRVPEEAALVRVTAEGRAPIDAEPIEGPAGETGDFYLIALPADTEGRVNWIDRAGAEGSRGIELLPP